jgi:transposase, IS5 family
MPRQPAIPGRRQAKKKKRTRREKFLAEMDAVVSWLRFLAPVAPHYPRVGPKGGRPPMPLETMLRVYFLQQWYGLSDPMAEEARSGRSCSARQMIVWRPFSSFDAIGSEISY